MSHPKNLDLDSLYTYFWIPWDSKVYTSNIWYILVSSKGDFVYKVFTDSFAFEREKIAYSLLSQIWIPIPKYEVVSSPYAFIKLENVRKFYKRKERLVDLDIVKVAQILSSIHAIKEGNLSFILRDIHVSNFYEILLSNWERQLWIFDFSSWKYGEKEFDLANIYIDVQLDDIYMKKFQEFYTETIHWNRLYTYAIYELYDRVKNGMNLSLQTKKMYLDYMLILKKKLAT